MAAHMLLQNGKVGASELYLLFCFTERRSWCIRTISDFSKLHTHKHSFIRVLTGGLCLILSACVFLISLMKISCPQNTLLKTFPDHALILKPGLTVSPIVCPSLWQSKSFFSGLRTFDSMCMGLKVHASQHKGPACFIAGAQCCGWLHACLGSTSSLSSLAVSYVSTSVFFELPVCLNVLRLRLFG